MFAWQDINSTNSTNSRDSAEKSYKVNDKYLITINHLRMEKYGKYMQQRLLKCFMAKKTEREIRAELI